MKSVPAWTAVAAVGELGEPSRFFWSSSELSTLVELFVLKGRPKESLRDVDDVLGPVPAIVDKLLSFPSLLRLPYLFFKYLAQELNEEPSFSAAAAAPTTHKPPRRTVIQKK